VLVEGSQRVFERSTTSSTVKSVRPVSPRIASADFMKRRSRGSVPAASGDRPLGFAMVETFRVVVAVMTLPVF
jgi:hypothetical protein